MEHSVVNPQNYSIITATAIVKKPGQPAIHTGYCSLGCTVCNEWLTDWVEVLSVEAIIQEINSHICPGKI